MKITVIGSGAMGCLFGGLLAEAGVDVQLLDVWPEHVQALNEQGLSITCDGETRVIRVQAFTDPAEIRKADLVLIFVKHAQTRAAAETAIGLLEDSGYLLTLQNGMGNAEILAEVAGAGRVLCGTTAQGAMLLGPGQIQHSGVGRTIIGMWDGDAPRVVQHVAELLSSAAVPTETTSRIQPVLWSKLFANVGINAVTALTGIRNGQLLDLEATRAVVKAAVTEAIDVACSLQVEVAENALANVFAIAEATGPNRSSMGQDVDARRPTEIDAINGYIVRRGEESGVSVPVNQALTCLIRTLQAHY